MKKLKKPKGRQVPARKNVGYPVEKKVRIGELRRVPKPFPFGGFP